MLLFKPAHVPLILNGTKTQTRRIWKRKRCNVGATHLAKTVMLSKEYFAKLKILRVWEERLGDISQADAKAEGYLDRKHYFAAFFTINKIKVCNRERWLANMVWCVEFEAEESLTCQHKDTVSYTMVWPKIGIARGLEINIEICLDCGRTL